jgi:putative drug exporter of the RND superfamily
VSHGIRSTAGVVTSAAVIMVAVFAVFGTLSMQDFKQLGVGLAAAILLDATLIRVVLLPSVMALLRERNWYLPRWLARLPRMSHGADLPGDPSQLPVRQTGQAVWPGPGYRARRLSRVLQPGQAQVRFGPASSAALRVLRTHSSSSS